MTLNYPEDLHDLHNDYPLAPEKLVIENNFEVSDYCRNTKNKFNLNKSKVPKLVSTLSDKKGYFVHAKLVRYYITHGLKVNVTKILMFFEKSWMKTFIEFNIIKRKEVK